MKRWTRDEGRSIGDRGTGIGEQEMSQMSEKTRSFKDLRVWRKAYELALYVYKVTKKFPKDELYGMVSQMRRASISIVSNIAEGNSRRGKAEYIQFLSIAYGSLSELETQILLSRDLGYLTKEELDKLLGMKDETGAMLYKLIQRLIPGPRFPLPETG